MAGRPKNSDIEKESIKTLNDLGYKIVKPNYKVCSACGKEKSLKESNFYISFSDMNKADGLMNICKVCIGEKYKTYLGNTAGDEKYSTYLLCRDLDAVWNVSAWDGAVSSKKKTLGSYFKNINSLGQTSGLKFRDSDPYELSSDEVKEKKAIESGALKLSMSEKQARKEIIESIGRDPYSDFSLTDQKALYPELVEYIDEEIRENPFLVGQIIQITINNNTIKKLNETLSGITKDVEQLTKNQDDVKKIADIIKNLSQTTTTIAKENGIAKKNSDSKKRSSLTGMMLYYRDLDLEKIEVDFYNQKVCYGMQRVAEISNKAIFDQELFGDQEYQEILQESRSLVSKFENRVLELEEENRLLELKIHNMKREK